MLFEQVPQVLQVLLLQNFTCLVLQEASARLLADLEVQRVLIGRLFEEEARDGLERGVPSLFNLLLLLEELEEFDICLTVVFCGGLVLLALIEAL